MVGTSDASARGVATERVVADGGTHDQEHVMVDELAEGPLDVGGSPLRQTEALSVHELDLPVKATVRQEVVGGEPQPALEPSSSRRAGVVQDADEVGGRPHHLRLPMQLSSIRVRRSTVQPRYRGGARRDASTKEAAAWPTMCESPRGVVPPGEDASTLGEAVWSNEADRWAERGQTRPCAGASRHRRTAWHPRLWRGGDPRWDQLTAMPSEATGTFQIVSIGVSEPFALTRNPSTAPLPPLST